MSITFTTPNPFIVAVEVGTTGTPGSIPFTKIGAFSFSYDPSDAIISEEVTETASDGTTNTLITGVWSDTLDYSGGAGIDDFQIQVPVSFLQSHLGGTVT